MTDPADRPEPGSINEATRRAVAADRARVVAAEQAARRRRGSVAGRLDRGLRWLRNRQSGPLPRLRRVGGVAWRTIRGREPWRQLPEALATALLAPVRIAGKPSPPPPPRDWGPERAAATARLAAFAARRDLVRPRVAVIADAAELDAFRTDWALVVIRPEDWAAVLAAEPPDLLVVDAARNGNGGAWAYRIAWTAHPDAFGQRDLRALVGWCTARSIPAIFRAPGGGVATVRDWSDVARYFDLVLAPDAEARAGYESLPDRRGTVVLAPWAETAGAAVVRGIRAAA
ncbi:MAG TPA: hypothetical protein VFO50_04355 [Candidatus Limnocylindrales bacterium]|nr:hypothetical protein [Candidatus Limnocylindrales bacterium]